ncbi:hypothetical protein D3C73_984310 [compost metagenome]
MIVSILSAANVLAHLISPLAWAGGIWERVGISPILFANGRMIGVPVRMVIPVVVADLKPRICFMAMLHCLVVLNTRHLGSHYG